MAGLTETPLRAPSKAGAVLLALAAASLAAPAFAATLIATPATFAAVNAQGRPGDVVQLGGGDFGDLVVRRPGVAYTCGSAPAGAPFVTLRTFAIIAPGDGVTFDGLGCRVVYTPNANTTSNSPAVKAVGVKAPVIRNLVMVGGPAIVGVDPSADPATPRPGDNVKGLPTGTAILLQNTDGAVVQNVEASRFFAGIATAGVIHTRLVGNRLHDLRTTCVHGGALSDLTIAATDCRNSTPWKEGGKGDHVDCFHLWTQDGGAPMSLVAILNNSCVQTRPVPGISLDDNARGIGFTGALIAGNLIQSAHASGIVVEHCIGCTIRDNRLVQSAGDWRHAPSIWATAGSVGTVLTHNTGPDLHGALAAAPPASGNVIVPVVKR